ncbi:hypothetical protein FA13DRAFT_557335 [Coprinellus micaceus]|uniref:Uncharacterized protein n=1 Tax=Coprinellus micaceus TaxID=71717 RepID=A0A4Y7SBF6_COPMI|nr:hypothetical protein FA13DRAFT_557335 [Coprinellus micaceus]
MISVNVQPSKRALGIFGSRVHEELLSYDAKATRQHQAYPLDLVGCIPRNLDTPPVTEIGARAQTPQDPVALELGKVIATKDAPRAPSFHVRCPKLAKSERWRWHGSPRESIWDDFPRF